MTGRDDAAVLDPGLVPEGAAVMVATRDARLVPAVARGWGPEVAPDGRTVTLCVAAQAGSATRANLEENGAVAVAFGDPVSARGVQVKGAVTTLREPTGPERERVARHLDAFCAAVARVGLSAHGARRTFVAAGLVAVELSVTAAFDQTPGAHAGRAL